MGGHRERFWRVELDVVTSDGEGSRLAVSVQSPLAPLTKGQAIEAALKRARSVVPDAACYARSAIWEEVAAVAACDVMQEGAV